MYGSRLVKDVIQGIGNLFVLHASRFNTQTVTVTVTVRHNILLRGAQLKGGSFQVNKYLKITTGSNQGGSFPVNNVHRVTQPHRQA